MGTAQHTHGTQNIRSYAILQLLLGNIGVAGGGVNAMRGESNVQGSTDQGLSNDALPGYLKLPVEADVDLTTYLKRVTPVAANPGQRELAAEHAEVRRQPAEGVVGRARPLGRMTSPSRTCPKLGARIPGTGLRLPRAHPRHARRRA